MKKRRALALATALTVLVSMCSFSPAALAETGGTPVAALASAAQGDFDAERIVDDRDAPEGYFKASYRNNAAALTEANAILAIYDSEGRLAFTEVKPFEAAAYQTKDIKFDVAAALYPSDEFSFKVFCWNANFAPLAPASDARINVAKRKAAYQSGAVDEFNTGTLVSDGIISKPVARSFSAGPWEALTRYYREWIYVDLGAPTAISEVTTSWGPYYATRYHIQTSDDAAKWVTRVSVGSNTYTQGAGGGDYSAAWANAPKTDAVPAGVTARYVRVLCDSVSGGSFTGQGNYQIKGLSVNGSAIDTYYASNGFDSCWISKSADAEWVYVDLGAAAKLTGAKVTWGANYATDYDIQVSDDGKDWVTKAQAAADRPYQAVTSDFVAEARYLRLLCKTSSGDNYMVKELEALSYEPLPAYALEPQPTSVEDGKLYLTGGNWKLERGTEVKADGFTLSTAGYDDYSWLPASVPGTTFASYLKAGAVGDPYYDNYNLDISDTYFTTDFWYRNSFVVPESQAGKDVWLNFDEINYRADVYFNGHYMSNNTNPRRSRSIEGGFIRGKFDVTPYVNYGGENYLAVMIQNNDTPWGYSNTTPGGVGAATNLGLYITKYVTNQYLNAGPWPNGGNIGIDNPTFHASLGWDWAPTVRGRDTGINEDVYLSFTDGVEMLDPWMVTDLDVQPAQTVWTAAPLTVGPDSAVSQPSGQSGTGLQYLFDGDLNESRVWLGDSGAEHPTFTLELPAAVTANTMVITWGQVRPALATEYQNAKTFKLEVSDDGETWRNYDAYPAGGTGANAYPASDGTAVYEGGVQANTIMGPTNPISGAVITRTFKYLRFTTLEKMTSVLSDQGTLPPKVVEVQLFSQAKSALDQSGIRKYDLDASKADLTFKTEVKNNRDVEAQAVIEGVVNPGGLAFSKTVSVPAGSVVAVDIPFVMDSPDLWWPNTYGEQPLYVASAKLSLDGKVSDVKSFNFGVREFTYPTDSGAANRLGIYCNGTFIIAKGGNWGMDDALQMDTPERYDDKVRLHAEENMTMIRNWVGQTHHKGFYDACDKYGLMIWDDFWLANPYDGPNPKDPDMFQENAIDRVKTTRSHPSLTVYCGRNESSPAAPIQAALPVITSQYDGTRFYFPNSAGAPVGSGGGYSLANYNGVGTAQGMKQYFTNVSSNVLRSERGIPNVPTVQSIRRFVAPENQWPISETWAHHDWTYMMNGPANTYMNALKSYMPKITWTFPNSPGGSQNQSPETTVMINYRNTYTPMLRQLADWYTLEEFSTVAQAINYENHKALFQALTVTRANGLLMWMSQSSWPSFMWQTYDYYLDTNGGYFGTKAGNQPTQPVWDPRNDNVYLSNFTTKDYADVKTEMAVYNLNGRLITSSAITTAFLESDAYGVLIGNLQAKFALSDTPMIFIKLTLKDSGGKLLGENIYWHNKDMYLANQALTTLDEVALTASVSQARTLSNGNVEYTITLKNETSVPAVQTRIRNISSATDDDVLPTFFSDNYFTLLPGDSKTVTAEFNPKNLAGGVSRFELSGWNTAVRGIN
ncbi:MAG: discoidin domain-containing protein [Clostridiales Family XIII bacterium]|jgi:beta-galactosidase/beta-glucuronidase|nr:discoidin domain-containing protein [Clostridiales Family XIII bacterium]